MVNEMSSNDIRPVDAIMEDINRREYQKRIDYIEMCRRGGIWAHSKHIECPEWMRHDVKMFRHVELNDVIELYSEPFDTQEEAQHFADCFNDSFLAEAECIEESGKYVVYSGYLIKHSFSSYAINDNQCGRYYLFANWS